MPPNETALRLFNCVSREISELGAVNAKVVVPPVAVITPISEILPPAASDKFLPTVEEPSCSAPVVVSVTSFAPLLIVLTVPLKLLLFPKLIELAATVNLEVPGTVIVVLPSCEIFEAVPVVVTVKLFPTLVAPKVKGNVFLILTSFVP